VGGTSCFVLLHDKWSPDSFICAYIVVGAISWSRNPACSLCLAEKALAVLLHLHLSRFGNGDSLDGHDTINLRITRLKHGAHGSAADLGENFIAAELFCHLFHDCVESNEGIGANIAQGPAQQSLTDESLVLDPSNRRAI